MSKNNNGGFFLGALFGAAVAGITALLYAPKAGEDLRKDVADEVDDLIARARDYKDSVLEQGVEMFDAASETAAEVSEDIKINVKLQAENLKTQFNELKEEGIKFADKKQSEVEEAVETGKDVADKAKEKANETKEEAEKNIKEVADEGKKFAKNAKDKAEDTKEEAEKNLEELADEIKE